MKRFLFTACFVLFTLFAFGQTTSENTLKFLGFPVDGSKEKLIKNLKTKGFTEVAGYDVLKGTFNGQSCRVRVHTNYGKVDRVMVAGYAETYSQSNVIISFNSLLHQFRDNSKYVEIFPNVTIPSEEDIRYEMTVNNKRYEASFYLVPQLDTAEIANVVEKKFIDKYPQYDVDSLSEKEQEEAKKAWLFICFEEIEKKAIGCVWFMIDYNEGVYEILIFYDNPLNRPKGDDL